MITALPKGKLNMFRPLSDPDPLGWEFYLHLLLLVYGIGVPISILYKDVLLAKMKKRPEEEPFSLPI